MEKKGDFRNYYEILEPIEKNSFGIVYKARHKASKELRAVKFIKINEEFDEEKNELKSNQL